MLVLVRILTFVGLYKRIPRVIQFRKDKSFGGMLPRRPSYFA